jgi:hypothetical protein
MAVPRHRYSSEIERVAEQRRKQEQKHAEVKLLEECSRTARGGGGVGAEHLGSLRHRSKGQTLVNMACTEKRTGGFQRESSRTTPYEDDQ